MPLVAGVDSSTQSTKVVVVDRDTGAIVREGRAAHPAGTSCDPRAWLDAWRRASDGLLDGVAAVSVGGQQHGMVVLDESGAPVRDALLWNDLRSAGDAEDLIRELGGTGEWISAVGSVPVAAFTVTKLRWLARHEPGNAARAHRVMLPHDWLTWHLAGCPDEATTDRGDASGTGYWSPSTGEYRLDLLGLAFGRSPRLPHVAAPREIVGGTSWGAAIAAGTGDNMAAAFALDAGPGDVIVSIGTSGTVFAVTDLAPRDPTGQVVGFADATGRFLPLVCTNNAAQVLTATARMLGVDLGRFSDLALSAPPGAEGVTMLPYLEGERTPNRPSATAEIAGLRLGNATPPNLARAAVEAMLCGLADGLDALRGTRGVEPRRILLIGGGSRSEAVRRIAPTVFGMPVHLPRPAEYVALGAARQAAWAHGPGGEPPAWPATAGLTHDAPATPGLRERFAELRDRHTGRTAPESAQVFPALTGKGGAEREKSQGGRHEAR